MNTQQLKELAQQATPWPWKWFTSNSHNRLSSVPSGKDGDVISAFKAADGAACVSISQDDMDFIEAAHPGAVLELIERLEAAGKLAEFRLKSINSMDALVAGRNNRIAELESWVRGVEEAMISATDHAAAAERERDEYKHRCKVSDGACGIAEQQRDHWMQRAKAAERERDELRHSDYLMWHAMACKSGERAKKAEAEIAQRDAAASEPVAVVDIQRGRGDGKKFALCYTSARHSLPDDVYNLYTVAPPAVLLQSDIDRIVPAIDPDGLDEAKHYIEHALYIDRERIRSELKELGAQPQKPAAEVEELSMQIRRLVHSLKNSNPDSSLLKSVPDYMQRKGYWKATDCLRGEHD